MMLTPQQWEKSGIQWEWREYHWITDENVVATGVPSDGDIIASVQPTESTPPTLQEDEFDNDIDNCSEEFMPPSADEAQKAAQILRAYFSSKENVETSLLHKLSDNDRTLAYTIATSKTQVHLSPDFTSQEFWKKAKRFDDYTVVIVSGNTKQRRCLLK